MPPAGAMHYYGALISGFSPLSIFKHIEIINKIKYIMLFAINGTNIAIE